jgi:IS66 Orf2 like protein
MLTFGGGRLFLVAGATDMRKSFNGLAGIVREKLLADPMSRHLFFCSASWRSWILATLAVIEIVLAAGPQGSTAADLHRDLLNPRAAADRVGGSRPSSATRPRRHPRQISWPSSPKILRVDPTSTPRPAQNSSRRRGADGGGRGGDQRPLAGVDGEVGARLRTLRTLKQGLTAETGSELHSSEPTAAQHLAAIHRSPFASTHHVVVRTELELAPSG